MKDQERCPKCGGLVYATHRGNEWSIGCYVCDFRTDTYESRSKARQAWEKMKERTNEKM